MAVTKTNIQKWVFAFLLATPVFYLYLLHFFHHDAAHIPSGFIQWEHILYMCSAKEYFTGNAHFFYEWPILNSFNNGPVFFQPQFLVLGYLWKWLGTNPSTLMAWFDFIFAVLTLRMVIEIIYSIIPQYKYKKLITILFCWGGGVLSAAGILLHFIFFNGSINNLSDNIFFLDPADGTWCLNFGRSLIYPLEAYYHFLFVSCIWLVLKRKFIPAFLLMMLLMLSHPYTAIEIISIVLTWMAAEIFYFKNNDYKKSQFYWMLSAFLLYFIYYAGILGRIETYRQINKLNALDWGYKLWHFLPAYAIVWYLSILCIKNTGLLKKHFSSSSNRLFFWWGSVAFLLSVHGFAIKPVQPIHFTRGYVYAGFFLFCIPALQIIIDKYKVKKTKGILIIAALSFLFLFDNITWFGYAAEKPNNVGVYFTKEETELINFFKQKNNNSVVIDSGKNYPLSAAIQLYADSKAWVPHPFLTFDLEHKRKAVEVLLQLGQLDSTWQKRNVYLYCHKNDGTLPYPNLQHKVFENNQYKVFQINLAEKMDSN